MHLIRQGRARRSGESAGPVVLLVPGSDGNPAVFVRLAGLVPAGPAVFAFQSRGLEPGEQTLSTVEQIAAAYLEEAVRTRPHGPYVLGGWSMGAYVALEMARQADEAGLDVAGLHLIAPAVPVRGGYWARRKARRELRARLRDTQAQLEQAQAADPAALQKMPLWDLADDPLDEPAERPADQLRRDLVNLANLAAGAHYRPRRAWKGRTVLYLPQEDPADVQEQTLSFWSRVVPPGPQVVALNCEHHHAVYGAAAQTVAASLGPRPDRTTNPYQTANGEEGVLK
nr:alpha/beta fold hydrolase [Kineosporia rhizophila]